MTRRLISASVLHLMLVMGGGGVREKGCVCCGGGESIKHSNLLLASTKKIANESTLRT